MYGYYEDEIDDLDSYDDEVAEDQVDSDGMEDWEAAFIRGERQAATENM